MLIYFFGKIKSKIQIRFSCLKEAVYNRPIGLKLWMLLELVYECLSNNIYRFDKSSRYKSYLILPCVDLRKRGKLQGLSVHVCDREDLIKSIFLLC
jgi:hypothetical protein